VKVNNLILK